MKLTYFAVLASLTGIVLSTVPASAADSVDQAIEALNSTSVYIQEGTRGTDRDTVAEITSFTSTDDHIIVVMLAEGTSSHSNDQIAKQILDSQKEPSILALYANGEVTGYTDRPYVPSVAVSEALRDAKSIAVGPTETITTFINQVHRYQEAHPEPVTTTSTSVPSSSSDLMSPPVLAVGSFALTIAVIIAVLRWRRMNRLQGQPTVHVRPKVKMFNNLADALQEDVDRIASTDDRRTMTEMVEILRDIVGKSADQGDGVVDATATGLSDKLVVMTTIVNGYLENQQYPDLPGAWRRSDSYSSAFRNFLVFARKQMDNLLHSDYQALSFEIDRWQPHQDKELSSMLNID